MNGSMSTSIEIDRDVYERIEREVLGLRADAELILRSLDHLASVVTIVEPQ